MLHRQPSSVFASAFLLLAGCAGNQVTEPAKSIGAEIAAFQGSLSSFQDDLKSIQDDERATITGTGERRDAAIASTKELQLEWTIAHAKSEIDVFTPLQTQGKEEVVRLLVPATQPSLPASVTFPLDKLSAVAKTMDQLAKNPGTKADLEFLVSYGASVNKQLKTIEDQAKPKPTASPAAPAQPKPTK